VIREALERVKLVGFSMFAAIAYGIAHDMVTAHVCVEYFTIGHSNLLDEDPHGASPVLQALLWGVLATWWVGAAAGVLISIVARAGPAPRLGVRDVVRPVLYVYCATALAALMGGLLGASLAAGGAVAVGSRLARELPAETHVRFLADGWAHGAAYLMAVVAVLVLAGNLLGTRIRRVKEESTRDPLLGLPPARSDRGAE